MAVKVQDYIGALIKKRSEELEKAYLNIPADKRAWSPEDRGRSANDQLAEVAMLNYNAAFTATNKILPPDFNLELYFAKKKELASDDEAALSRFRESVPPLVAAIEAVADEDFDVVVQFPWGPIPITDIIAYPLYNLSYHEGQINYIASLLGCL
jgi:hypothetical protein